MKTQNKKELHTKTTEELTGLLKEARAGLKTMRLDKEMGRLKNTSSLRGKRLEVAVLQTIMREKSIREGNSIEEKKDEEAPKTASAKAKAVKPVRKSQGKGGEKSE